MYMKNIICVTLLSGCISSTDPKANQEDSNGLEDLKDSDGDGVPDYIEDAMGTNPESADSDENGIPDSEEDSDGDGLPDYIEIMWGLNPTAIDTDGDGTWDGEEDTDEDGLTNVEELVLGTDGSNPDTDGDGVSDYVEVWLFGTSPTEPNPDSDGDGFPDKLEDFVGTSNNHFDYDVDGDYLPDVGEERIGTDYTNPDTDGDGFIDSMELLLGLDPTNADIDTDGDGLPDELEELLGLDPTSGDSNPDDEHQGDVLGVLSQMSDGGSLLDVIPQLGFGLVDCDSVEYETPSSAEDFQPEETDECEDEEEQPPPEINPNIPEWFVGEIKCDFGTRQLIASAGSSEYNADFYDSHLTLNGGAAIENADYNGKELMYLVDNENRLMTITLKSTCTDMDMFAFYSAELDQRPDSPENYTAYDFIQSSRVDGLGIDPAELDQLSIYASNAAPHVLLIESKNAEESLPFVLEVTCD